MIVFYTLLYEATVESFIVNLPDGNSNETENETGNQEGPLGIRGSYSDETDDGSESRKEESIQVVLAVFDSHQQV